MRKVVATAIVKDFKLINLTVTLNNGDNIPLVYYSEEFTLGHENIPFKYESYSGIIKSILNILKSNDFYVSSWKDFGLKWYAINFIDVDNPTQIKHYGVQEN